MAASTDMRRAIATLREQGVVLYTIALETVLAEVEAQEGQLEAANATVDRALTDTERTGHRWFEAETHRIRGEILLKRDLSNTAPVEEAFPHCHCRRAKNRRRAVSSCVQCCRWQSFIRTRTAPRTRHALLERPHPA